MVVAAVLVSPGPVEGVGAGSEIPDPLENPGPEGALGAAGGARAGAGSDAK